MKIAADLLHTIATNHGVALPADNTPTAPPTATRASATKPGTTKRRRKAQDEDDNATPSDSSEAASSSTDTADSAQFEPQTSSQTPPVQIADAGHASAGDAASIPGNAPSSSNTYTSTSSSAKNGASTGDGNSDSDSNPLWLPLTLLATVAPAHSADAADAMAQLAAATEPAAPDAGTPSESQALAAIWRAYNGAVDGQSGFDWQPPAQPLSAGVGTTGGHDAGVQSAWLDANPGSLLAHQVL